MAVQTLKDWRSQFPGAQPEHAAFPREAYALEGKKGTFGGSVAGVARMDESEDD